MTQVITPAETVADVTTKVINVEQRSEFAIQLPNKTWWRKLSLRRMDPDGASPSIFHNRAVAEDELFDLIGQAREVYGIGRSYAPRLMFRNVQISTNGVMAGSWRPVTALAKASATAAEAEQVQR